MIRKATQRDLDAVLDILAKTVPIMQASGNNQWDSEYPNRQRFLDDIIAGSLYIYDMDGTPVGFVCVDTEEPPEYDAVCWQTKGPALVLHRMAVSPEFRGLGLAMKMATFCEDLARQNGYTCIHSDTNSKNIPVNALFKKLGYSFCGNITLRDTPDLFNCYEKQIG